MKFKGFFDVGKKVNYKGATYQIVGFGGTDKQKNKYKIRKLIHPFISKLINPKYLKIDKNQ